MCTVSRIKVTLWGEGLDVLTVPLNKPQEGNKSSQKLGRVRQGSRCKLDAREVEREADRVKNRETFGSSYWKNSKYSARHIKKSHSVENSKKNNSMRHKR